MTTIYVSAIHVGYTSILSAPKLVYYNEQIATTDHVKTMSGRDGRRSYFNTATPLRLVDKTKRSVNCQSDTSYLQCIWVACGGGGDLTGTRENTLATRSPRGRSISSTRYVKTCVKTAKKYRKKR